MTAMTEATKMMMMITLVLAICFPGIVAQWSDTQCVPGDNLVNEGGSCNFGSTSLTLCDWQNMEANPLTWKNYYNDLNKSPSVYTDTKDLALNQIVRLKSPLLCATNSTYLVYRFSFTYSIFLSDICRFSLSVFSAGGLKLAEIWNTQKTTYDPRSNDWNEVKAEVSNSDSSFYLIFALERISSAQTTTVALDTLTYTSTPIPTTTPAPPTTTFNTTTTTTYSTTTTAAAITTPATTTQATTTTTVTTPEKTTSTTTVSTADAASLIWGLSLDAVIGIGVSIVIFIVIVIAIAIACRRARREEDVKTVSFALNAPSATAYNVNEEKKLTGKRKKDMKARASVLVPSKHSDWQPDRSLY